MGSFEDVTKRLNAVLSKAFEDLNSGNPKTVMSKHLSDFNEELTKEARRLKVPLPPKGLPNPEHLATDISNLMKHSAKKLLNDPRGQRDVRRTAMDIKTDTVRDVARADRDIQEAKKHLPGMINEVAPMLKEFGVDIPAAELQ